MLRRVSASTSVRLPTTRVARRGFGAFGCRRPVVEDVFRVHFTPFTSASRPRWGERVGCHGPSSSASSCRVAPVSCADFFSSATSPFVRIHEGEVAAELELEVPRFRVADLHIEKNGKEGTITITGKRPAAAASRTSDDTKAKDFEAELRQFFSKVVESATTTPSEFQKSLQFSPKHYDVEATTWTLDHGILSLKVPRVKAPVAISIVSDAKAAASSSIVKITPEEFAAIAAAPWPPAVHKAQAANGAVEYTVALPPAVTTDHLALHFDERAQTATLAVACSFESSGTHRTQSQSVNFLTTLVAPEGTRPELVSAELKKGVLTVRFVTAPATPATPSPNAAPTTASQ